MAFFQWKNKVYSVSPAWPLILLLPLVMSIAILRLTSVVRANFKTVFGVWLVETPPTSDEGGFTRPQRRAICSRPNR